MYADKQIKLGSFHIQEPNKIVELKFTYSEKATKFCEISTVDLFYVLVPIKYTEEISQNFVAFSEYMNFKDRTIWL